MEKQIYRFAPDVPVPQGLLKYLHGQLKTPDRVYKSSVLQLFDLWGEELPKLSISPKIKSQIQVRLLLSSFFLSIISFFSDNNNKKDVARDHECRGWNNRT